jgi:hypothetical protein
MDSQRFIRAIFLPFTMGLVNKIIFTIFVRHTPNGVSFNRVSLESSVIVGFVIILAILLYLGWRVATIYSERRLLKAAGLGLFLWFIFSVVLTVVFDFLFPFAFGLGAPEYSVLKGSLFGFVVVSPLAVIVSMAGALINTRFRKLS